MAVAFLAVVFTPLPNLLARRLILPPRLGPAQAIVVLSAGIEDRETPSPISTRRLIHAVRLYRQGLAPVIIVSGGAAGQEAATGAVMASLAGEFRIPRDAILTETESYDTWTEAWGVARLARSRGVERILLVTHPLHVRRATRTFERAGFEVLPASWEGGATARRPADRLLLMRDVCLEGLAGVYYRVRGWL